jgi:hypothetical protein
LGDIDLYKQYCGFFEQHFEKQLEVNERYLREHLVRWGKTGQAKRISPNGFAKIEKIPITD